MRPSWPRRSMAVVCGAMIATGCLVAACSNSPGSTAPPASASAPAGDRVALGTNNPAQGDCTTDKSEAATSVGSAVLSLTPSSFQAEVQLQEGPPNTTYGIFMQQVPGSCPQSTANGGTFTTDSAGHLQASATVARVAGATTFYIQLVPSGAGPPDFTSDRISATP